MQHKQGNAEGRSTPAAPGQAIGSAGSTTGYRMDVYAPYLPERGLMGTIGKGKRNEAVRQAVITAGAVHRPEIKNFPVVVLLDACGGDLYQSRRAEYLASIDGEGSVI